jgi:pseudouridine-5'-monophosphatase
MTSRRRKKKLIIFFLFVINCACILDIMSVTHCIFDLDGLLLDTESIYTECLQELCAPYGKNFSMGTKLEMMGKSSLEAGQILIRR